MQPPHLYRNLKSLETGNKACLPIVHSLFESSVDDAQMIYDVVCKGFMAQNATLPCPPQGNQRVGIEAIHAGACCLDHTAENQRLQAKSIVRTCPEQMTGVVVWLT